MKRAFGVIALTCAVTGVGTAHADTGTFSGSKGDYDVHAYWVDVASVGVGGTAVDAQNLGLSICMMLDGGQSTGQVVDKITTGVSSALGALTAVDAAEWHFCPEHY